MEKQEKFKNKVGMTFDAFYKKNYKRLIRALFSYNNSLKQDAIEDAVTDAFMFFLDKIDQYEPSLGSPYTFVNTIVRNNLNMAIKKKKDIFSLDIIINDDSNSNETYADRLTIEEDDDTLELNRELLQKVIPLLDKLPPEKYKIFNHRITTGDSYSDMVDIFNIPLYQIKNDIRYCREKLKSFLKLK